MVQALLAVWTFFRVLRAMKKSEPAVEVALPRSGIVSIGATYVPKWKAISFDTGIAVEAKTGDKVIGVVLNAPTTGDVLINGCAIIDDSIPGRFLIDNGVDFVWRDYVKLGDIIHATVIYRKLFITEKIMSYATGKSDFSDYKIYQGQNVSNWSYAPVKFQPVQIAGGALTPAYADTEVIYGVVLESTQETDAQGNTTGYTIKVLIAEAELDDGTLNMPGDTHGKPLYVQNYSAVATPVFADIYSTDAPSAGFTHPLYIVSSATSLHYNGTVRPDAV
jgi:hypothetical protein